MNPKEDEKSPTDDTTAEIPKDAAAVQPLPDIKFLKLTGVRGIPKRKANEPKAP